MLHLTWIIDSTNLPHQAEKHQQSFPFLYHFVFGASNFLLMRNPAPLPTAPATTRCSPSRKIPNEIFATNSGKNLIFQSCSCCFAVPPYRTARRRRAKKFSIADNRVIFSGPATALLCALGPMLMENGRWGMKGKGHKHDEGFSDFSDFTSPVRAALCAHFRRHFFLPPAVPKRNICSGFSERTGGHTCWCCLCFACKFIAKKIKNKTQLAMGVCEVVASV